MTAPTAALAGSAAVTRVVEAPAASAEALVASAALAAATASAASVALVAGTAKFGRRANAGVVSLGEGSAGADIS